MSIHVVLNQETEECFLKKFTQMKKGAYLINTSRGKVINQKALGKALEEGYLGGAALDVYEVEPPMDQELLSLPNLICTPHIGGSTEEAFSNATEILVRKIKEIFHIKETAPLGS